jgi:1-acyl-sn-glycerol-3-phosphate acyltransferase
MFNRVARFLLRQLGFAYFRLQVDGLHRIPARGPAILAGNHPNVLDGILLLMVSPRPVRFLVTEELFFHPFLHWIFEGMGCIPVYRTKTNNGDALRAAVEALERGEVIGIFPEGTTSDLGRMRAVKRGVGLLTLRTGAPVVPFGVWGSAEAYPTGTRLPRPRPIAIAFAPLVSYGRTTLDPIPTVLLQNTLDDVRSEILRPMRWAMAAHRSVVPRWPLKPIQVALSSCIVLPLAGVLSLTANPSLDPADKSRNVS